MARSLFSLRARNSESFVKKARPSLKSKEKLVIILKILTCIYFCIKWNNNAINLMACVECVKGHGAVV